MKKPSAFKFNSSSVANAYDTVLVPVLFEPWAESLIKENSNWKGTTVLELACGTGVLTKKLIKNVGFDGKVFALDINKEMIDVAKINCANEATFIHGTAEKLELAENAIDKVVCQQGFQFFPNQKQVAHEIFKVLKKNGKGIITTWSPVSECDIFQTICDTLESLDLNDLSNNMKLPFGQKNSEPISLAFEEIGFSEIKTAIQKKKLFLNKKDAPEFVYSTPIGPKLKELSSQQQEAFKDLLINNLTKLENEDGSLGYMTSNILSVKK